MAYTPQQKRVIEQMNRTLIKRIRVILRYVGLPNSFLGEIAKTVCYMVNQSPSIVIELKTLIEM